MSSTVLIAVAILQAAVAWALAFAVGRRWGFGPRFDEVIVLVIAPLAGLGLVAAWLWVRSHRALARTWSRETRARWRSSSADAAATFGRAVLGWPAAVCAAVVAFRSASDRLGRGADRRGPPGRRPVAGVARGGSRGG